ncbi:hypothetical protein AVEN_124909-1 [Araneus ventricosus]|uniref:Uncharacterized protein n=1 Tax=Araneus ventricosus TaxID=182803 RepID=A0A4Y2WCA6_ARAVE|nr:hypothetical protein AVEN_124909-1 [Araneus ventricosus]
MCFGRDHCLGESYLWAIADTSDNLVILKDTRKFLIDYSLMVSPDLSNEQNGKLSELLLTFPAVFPEAHKSTATRANVKHRIISGIMHLYIKEPTLSIDRKTLSLSI